VELNGQQSRVVVHVAAVADRALAQVELYSARAGGSMEWTLVEEFATREGASATGSVERPEAVTLDDEFPPGAQLDLIKMDIEGAEVLALKGARRVLRELRPVIVLEYHRDVAWPAIGELLDAGYSFESLAGEPLSPPRDTQEVPYQFVARPPAS
jgi:FkbM family methyltransferase